MLALKSVVPRQENPRHDDSASHLSSHVSDLLAQSPSVGHTVGRIEQFFDRTSRLGALDHAERHQTQYPSWTANLSKEFP
jgi:hypothetical protein